MEILPGLVLKKEASREASQTVQENPTADFSGATWVCAKSGCRIPCLLQFCCTYPLYWAKLGYGIRWAKWCLYVHLQNFTNGVSKSRLSQIHIPYVGWLRDPGGSSVSSTISGATRASPGDVAFNAALASLRRESHWDWFNESRSCGTGFTPNG